MSRSGIMLAQPFEEKRLARWNTNTVIIQPKLDGERARAVFDHLGHVTLYSSESNIITSVPHINEQLEGLKLHDIEFDGELYVHEKPFEQIHSIVSRKVNEHYNSASMEYHIFDLVTPDPQRLRLIALNVFLSNETDNIKRIKWTEVVNFNNVVGALNAYKSEGYEGIILRHPAAPYVRKRSPFMMKFKPKKSDVYKIVGFQEEISIHGVPKNRLGAFILEGDDGTKFGVGTGFDDSQRAFFWQNREECLGKWCEVQYQSITTKGKVPRFPVFVQIRTDIL
jgi:DNA ligase-1